MCFFDKYCKYGGCFMNIWLLRWGEIVVLCGNEEVCVCYLDCNSVVGINCFLVWDKWVKIEFYVFFV